MNTMTGVLTTRILTGNDSVKILNNKSFSESGLKLTYDTLENIDCSNLEKYLLKKNDIIIMCVEPFNVGYILEDNVLATNALLKVTDEKLNSKEIYKILNTKKFKKYISNSTEGTNIKRLSAKHIKGFNYSPDDCKNADLYFELNQLIDIKNEDLENINDLANVLCQ